mmetsp:Transcript_16999/g.40956  ORF Transcript_16999/g.40956 Transcript_16999/m.40956 type:complete len:101 (-) Transcript_16999:53-355(-)
MHIGCKSDVAHFPVPAQFPPAKMRIHSYECVTATGVRQAMMAHPIQESEGAVSHGGGCGLVLGVYLLVSCTLSCLVVLGQDASKSGNGPFGCHSINDAGS